MWWYRLVSFHRSHTFKRWSLNKLLTFGFLTTYRPKLGKKERPGATPDILPELQYVLELLIELRGYVEMTVTYIYLPTGIPISSNRTSFAHY